MSRSTYIYLSFFLLLFFSCVKENDLSMDFKITGVKNSTIERGSVRVLPLTVFYLGGEKEDVVISVSTLPQGVTAEFDKTTGEPDFESTLTLHAQLNIANDTSIIEITGTSVSGKKFTKAMQLIIADPPNHSPVITLNGSVSMDITLNSPWVEPGFTATDYEDGDLTGQVNVTGTVNNNYAGLYTITYEVFDSKGYSTTILRTVHVNNSLQSLSGIYNCTTTISGGGTFIWNASSYIYASPTKNNFLVLPRMTDCYGLTIDVEVNGLLLTLPAQYQLGYNTNPGNSGICDYVTHLFAGSGTLAVGLNPVITLNYTDQYKDSTGVAYAFYKTDVYVRQ